MENIYVKWRKFVCCNIYEYMNYNNMEYINF